MADRRADCFQVRVKIKEPSVPTNFKGIVSGLSESGQKAVIHAVAVPKRNDL